MAERPADRPTGSQTGSRDREEPEERPYGEAFLRSILETQEEMLCRFLPDTTLTYVNERYCRMFGRTAGQLLGTRFLELVPEEGHAGVMKTLSRLSASNRSVTYDHEVTLPDGSIGWQQWTDTAIIDDQGNVAEIQSTGRDITRQKKMETELVLQTRLQELLMNISATYISIPESEVDAAIHRSLAELGGFSGADRFYIFEYDFGRNTSTNTYEWCAPGIEPQINYLQDYPNEHIPDWVSTHRKGRIMHVSDVPGLPPDSSIRQMLEPQGIKSLIAVPMMDGSECVGFVGLDFVRQFHTITNYERKLLTIFAQMMVNVQNRIRTQKYLMENERFLADLIDKSASIIVVKNADGTYLLVNQKWQDITGIRREEALGRTDAELFDPKTARNFMENDSHVITTGKTIDADEVMHHGMEQRHFLSTKFPVRDSRGAITGVCGMIFEITDRKRAEEHRIARTEAEAANRAKTSFLSNMSHEIRTPLNAIIGFARILEHDHGISDKQTEYLRTILRSSEHLLSLVNQTLDYSRIEAGAETVNPTRFRTRRLVDDVLRMFEPKAKRIGLQYGSDVAQGVPEFILADEAKIRQVLVNLMSNALKVTESGAVTIRAGIRDTAIQREGTRQPAESQSPETHPDEAQSPESQFDEMHSAEQNGQVRLFFEVEDTGPGISKSEIRHLFSKYYRRNDGRHFEGTGLGLPISRKLAYLMDGEIEVETAPGKGSRFRLVLPVAITDRSDQAAVDGPKRVTRLAAGTGERKILVADDRRVNRDLMRAILEPAGYVVREAQNGQEAVDHFTAWQPDAVLMDLRMPVMDGLKATQKIRELEDGSDTGNDDPGNRTPVIAITSSILANRRPVRDTRGLDGFISHPVVPEDLLLLLGKHLGVTYATDDPPPEHHTAAARKLLTHDAIALLPTATVRRIRAATQEGDMIGLRKLAESLCQEHAAVSRGIRELAAAYDYDTLLDLFEEQRDGTP